MNLFDHNYTQPQEKQEAIEAKRTPINSWAALLALFNRWLKFDITAKEIREGFKDVLEYREMIQFELGKKTKKILLGYIVQLSGQYIAYSHRNDSKAELTGMVFRKVCRMFDAREQTNTYTWEEMQMQYLDLLALHIDKYDDALLASKKAKDEAEIEEYKKDQERKKELAKDPYTFEAFRAWKDLNGEELPPHLQKRFIMLKAMNQWERNEASKTKVVSSVSCDVSFSDIIETTHTKKGHKLYVVQMLERVEKDVYSSLNSRAKQLGGYYSSYRGNGAITGFQFRSRENAESFMSLQEATKAKKERDTEGLREKANRMIEGANEALNADRQVNTTRRARHAASAIENAEAKLRDGQTLLKLSEALENKELTFLSKVGAFSELETLNGLLVQAKIAHAKKKQGELEGYKATEAFNAIYNRLPNEEDIDFVSFPFPSLYHEHVKSLAWKIEDIKGFKMFAARLHKKPNTGSIIFNTGKDLEQLRKVGNISDDWEYSRIKEQFKIFDRVKRIGLDSDELLKAALYELLSITGKGMTEEQKREKEIKRLEAETLRMKIDGYFPTPPELANRMVSLAGIKEGNSICEPSAGKGNIADVIKERHPNNPLALFEISHTLCNVLDFKNYHAHNQDFMKVDITFDKFIMNPPFEKGQDIDHVLHAYSLLNEGGRIVAIMSEGPFYRKDKKATEFREFLEDNGWSEQLPSGTFNNKETSTNVNTRIVVIDK